tara:strand:+ start:377 stop:1099 length:723 start_codon:yes stop_codon:yes gene_type:complete
MLPVFKSTYSIGKSILTIEKILELNQSQDNDYLLLVEDSMTGFVKCHNSCKELGIHLIFGLRLTCCNDVEEDDYNSDSKIIILAKNDEGCKLLNKIYSFKELEGNGKVDFSYLNSIWEQNNLDLVIPFYDSFIHQNQFYLKNCVPDFTKIKPSFWLENNNLPFDPILSKYVTDYSKDKYNTEDVKSIFYEKKEDVEALQTYKIICGRKFGRPSTLSCPNLDHFGSDEFCFESYAKLTHDK